jgi:SHS family lactate transporter-like MFS transporter
MDVAARSGASGPLVSETYTQNETRRTLVFAFLGTVFDGVELNLLSYPLIYLARSLHVGTAAIVGAVTAQGLASLAGGFLFGWLGDAIGRRRAFALCVFTYGLGTMLAAFAPNYGYFLPTRILAGLGIGGEFGLAFSMFSEAWRTERRGFMGGSIQSMFIVGEIITQGVLYLTLSSLGQELGWRYGFAILGIVSILIAAAAYAWVPESKKWLRYQQELKRGEVPAELKRNKVPYIDMFRGGLAGGTIAFVVIMTAIFMYSYSLGTFSPTFLLTKAKTPLAATTEILFIGFFVTILSYMIFATLSDYIARKWAFLLSNVVGVVGLAGYLFLLTSGNTFVGSQFWTSPMFWALTVAQGGFGGFAIVGVWMSEFFPTRIRSTGSNAAYYAGRGLGAGVYPLGALKLAGGDVGYALSLGIVGAVVGLVVATFTPDRTGREIHAVE